MNENSFKKFNQTVSWNTKFFVLMAFILVLVSFVFNENPMAITVGSMLALSSVLVLEYYEIFIHRHPKTWRIIKHLIIGIIILLALISIK